MNKYKYLSVVIFVCIFLMCCSSNNDDTVLNDTKDLVKVTFDLQQEFEGTIIVTIDGDQYFQAIITGAIPFSGPQASFTTYLERLEHTLTLRQEISNRKDEWSVVFNIGKADEYFIGLMLYENDLKYQIRETRFGYL